MRKCIEDISNNITEGAEAFVAAEMKILLPATVTLCLIVFVLAGSRGAKEILQSPVANAKPVSSQIQKTYRIPRTHHGRFLFRFSISYKIGPLAYFLRSLFCVVQRRLRSQGAQSTTMLCDDHFAFALQVHRHTRSSDRSRQSCPENFRSQRQ